MTAAQRQQLVADLLKSQSTLALSTVDRSGAPCVAPLFYVLGEDFWLYWFSSASSQHARNLKRSPDAAVAVYRATDEWEEIRGSQMRGSVATVTDPLQRKAITRAYTERFRLGAGFTAVIARSTLYEFRPTWVRYIDNSRRFGYKFEWTIANA